MRRGHGTFSSVGVGLSARGLLHGEGVSTSDGAGTSDGLVGEGGSESDGVWTSKSKGLIGEGDGEAAVVVEKTDSPWLALCFPHSGVYVRCLLSCMQV